MASRMDHHDDWDNVFPTKIQNTPCRVPRLGPHDGYPQHAFFKTRALRPKPLNVPSKPSITPSGEQEAGEENCEAPKTPKVEVIDTAPTATRLCRLPCSRGSSMASRIRQSETSPGTVDYCITNRMPSLFGFEFPVSTAPTTTPTTTVLLQTPKMDPLVADKLDFGLQGTLKPSLVLASSNGNTFETAEISDGKRADGGTSQRLIAISPPAATAALPKQLVVSKRYSLFPKIREIKPPTIGAPRHAELASTPPTIRPRKPTLSTYRQPCSRTLSILTRVPPTRPRTIPLALLSPASLCQSTPSPNPTIPFAGSNNSPSNLSTASLQSRWSASTAASNPEDLILASPPPPSANPIRTSFANLLFRAGGYPDCFSPAEEWEENGQEDDDDGTPLGARWAGRSVREIRGSEIEWDGKKASREWWRVLGCGCLGR